MLDSIFRVVSLLLILFSAGAANMAIAGAKEQAYTMFNKLNGVPPTSEKWEELTTLIEAGDLRGAALAAINDEQGNFYNSVLRQMVAPWTNENLMVRVPLNDYIATVIGMIRDEVPFNKVLTDDIVYVGVTREGDEELPPYTIADEDGNLHYEAIEERGYPLHQTLVKRKQSDLTYLTDDAAAGVLTTRAFGNAYYEAGTNRAAVRFTLMTFMCRDMEQFSDTTRPDYRVRRDVSRAPGGDSAVFRNRCAGCHAGMDAFGGAFAYMDYTPDEGLIYDPTSVRAKFNQGGNEFPDGFVTTDDKWLNMWIEGQNKSIGWRGATSGAGVKSFGAMLTASKTFSQCMAQRTLETICNVSLEDPQVKVAINQLAHSFEAKGRYNMKHLFAQAAIMCRGK